MFLIVYSGQRYKTNIIKTNLITIIFGWERELEGQGELGRESWEGRQGRLRSKPTRHCLVEQGQVGTERRRTGNGGRSAEVDAYEIVPRRTGDRWRRREDRLGTETGAGWERGQEPLATACVHYQLSSKSSQQTRSLTLRNGSKYAFLRHDKAGGYNLPRTEHCNAGVL